MTATPASQGSATCAGRIASVLLAVFLMVWAGESAAQSNASPKPSEAPQSIVIKAVPIDHFEPRDASRRRFGGLEFLGGLELTSPYDAFGGLSGLRIFPDGSQFLAVTDRARWLSGRIVYRGKTPIGIADAQMAPILGADGRAINSRRGWYDTEAVAEDAGRVFVALERVNQIVRFDYGKFGLLARGRPIPVPPAIGKLPRNSGLECLTILPRGSPGAGTLVAIAERALDGAGNHRGFLIDGPSPGEFSLVHRDGFDISDCTILPGGDLLVLERFFRWTSGLAVRLRRIARDSLKPGAVLDGRQIFEADLGYQIDNMEALGVHTDKDGTTILTMISDDNFSMLQRTLLLQFAIVDE